MGGLNKNMAYVMGPLQMAAGAALTATGAGAPIGIPLMAAGAGETIGKAAGGSRGAGMGEMFGGLAGGLGEGAAGFAGMGPMANMLSAAPGLQSVAQNPSVEAIGAQTVNLPGGGTMSLPPLAGGQQPLMGESAASLMTKDYPLATRLDMIPGYDPSRFGLGSTASLASPSSGGSFTSLANSPAAGALVNAATAPSKDQTPPTTAAPPKPSFTGPVQNAPAPLKGPSQIQPTVTQVPQRTKTRATPTVVPSPAPSVPGMGPSLQEALTWQQYLLHLQAMGLPSGLPLTGT